MTDHIEEAEACLAQLDAGPADNSDTEQSLLGRASVHSLISIAQNLARVAGRPVEERPLRAAREVVSARLVLHAAGGWPFEAAPVLALRALNGTTGTEHYAVAQAIALLRIELPA